MSEMTGHETSIGHSYPGIVSAPTAVRRWSWMCTCGVGGDGLPDRGVAERLAGAHVATGPDTEGEAAR
jgi:hypothetical protein